MYSTQRPTPLVKQSSDRAPGQTPIILLSANSELNQSFNKEDLKKRCSAFTLFKPYTSQKKAEPICITDLSNTDLYITPDPVSNI